MGVKMSTPNFPVTTLQAALAASVANGTFSDTAYYLYSRRGADAKANSLRPVFASSTVMKACSEYFAKQLSDSLTADIKMPEENDDYDYDTDSDLDEDEVLEDVEDDLSDISSVRSVSSCATEHPDQPKAKDEPSESFKIVEVPTAAPRPSTDREPTVQTKYRIFIPNVAATTWKALVYYIYTGDVFFASIKSSGGDAWKSAKEQEPVDGPAFCSPKSMYRLAGIVGLTELKKLAKQAIKGSLSEDCIADEVFSKFSSCHPEILQMQLAYLYDEGRLARVMPRIKARVKSAIRGGMTHVDAVLDKLLDKLSERMPAAALACPKLPTELRKVKAPADVAPPPSRAPSTTSPAPSKPKSSVALPPSESMPDVASSPPVTTPAHPKTKPEDLQNKSTAPETTKTAAPSTTARGPSARSESRQERPPEQPPKPDRIQVQTSSAPAPPVATGAQKLGPESGSGSNDRKVLAANPGSVAQAAATAASADQRAQAAQASQACQKDSRECSCSVCRKVKRKLSKDKSNDRVNEVLRSLQVNVWDTPS